MEISKVPKSNSSALEGSMDRSSPGITEVQGQSSESAGGKAGQVRGRIL